MSEVCMHAGVHYEDQEILGGDFVWRNVSGTCPSVADIIEEIELLETPTRTAPGPESTAVQTGGGGGAAVAAWVIMLLIISGAFPALSCNFWVTSLVIRWNRSELLYLLEQNSSTVATELRSCFLVFAVRRAF